MQPYLVIGPQSQVLVLTGAGVSAESGVPTFRGANGLWENHPVEEVASPSGFSTNPALVWRFYSERRANVAKARPNAGHECIAKLEATLGDRFLLVTQNVDGLHRAAGSNRVIELHGNLFRSRCSHCSLQPFHDERLYLSPPLPECSACESKMRSALLRPDIVWFGEMLNPDHTSQISDFIQRAASNLIFMAIGTSGNVYPAAGYVEIARAAGGQTWLINMEPAENGHLFDHFIRGPSGKVLPALLDR